MNNVTVSRKINPSELKSGQCFKNINKGLYHGNIFMLVDTTDGEFMLVDLSDGKLWGPLTAEIKDAFEGFIDSFEVADNPFAKEELKVGQLFEENRTKETYILAECGSKFILICLKDGRRWASPRDSLEEAFDGNRSDFKLITNPVTLNPTK